MGLAEICRSLPVGITGTALREKHVAPIRWAVEGPLLEGFVILAGKPKMGKLWMLLHTAMCSADGSESVLPTRLIEGGGPELNELLNPFDIKSRNSFSSGGFPPMVRGSEMGMIPSGAIVSKWGS